MNDFHDRDRQVISAMQRRAFRGPLHGLLWRKPWRAPHGPNWLSLRDTWQWLRAAHDCSDPAVGCSCSGGFRFPQSYVTSHADSNQPAGEVR